MLIENPQMNIEREVACFFRNYALDILSKQHIDSSDKRAVKQALIEYYEQIYPAFAETKIFKLCFEKEYHDNMVEAYKKNFYLLLEGIIPGSKI